MYHLKRFRQEFKVLTAHDPFPWQEALFNRFVTDRTDNIPASASIPTGLGKTNIIAVWLLAFMQCPTLVPRRLVYVVNRRTVVDQTTNEVEKLRNKLSELKYPGFDTLAISTLRGQFADNRQWSADPSCPAVVCGTVDMVGSRLLFSGYGIGYKSKPHHAGFLGQDVLLVHDEAHLEPAFQKLVEAIETEQDRERQAYKRLSSDDLPWPRLRVMELTATTRNDNDLASGKKLTLEQPDHDHPLVKQRIRAAKHLYLKQAEKDDKIADEIADIALGYQSVKGTEGDVVESKNDNLQVTNAAVLVFVNTIDDVNKVLTKLTNKKNGVSSDHVQQLTGTMRGLERDGLAATDPVFMRFLPEKNRNPDVKPAEGTVYLVSTSAGEVGVDISADHMICDLSTFESMAQRLGRVNRYGEPVEHIARIDVIHPENFGKVDKKTGKLKASEIDRRRQKTIELLKQLPAFGEGQYDASPLALSNLNTSERAAAFAPEPTIPPVTDVLFDAWALTSVRSPMPGRPSVEPYLHGIAEWEPPETYVVWRQEVEVVTGDLLEIYLPADLLDDYPLLPHELLRDRSDRVFKHLESLEKQHADKPVWIVNVRGDVEPTTTLRSLVTSLKELKTEDRNKRLKGCTILLPPSAGGLVGGMLDGSSEQAEDVADQWHDENHEQRRKRFRSDDPRPDGPQGMALIRTIDTDPNADERESLDGESGPGLINETIKSSASKQGRFWHWYVRPRDAEDATRASTKPIDWNHHTRDVVQRATEIVNALNLPDKLKRAIILAVELHDLGKKRRQWQRSIGNPNPADWYAKPGKPDNGPRWRPQHLSDYRHEFGSLFDVQENERFKALDGETQDLVLHLIAAHHGRARPHFTPEEAIDPERSSNEAETLAIEVPRRFARLQRKYGRWGLAYLESLLRAADWAASAEPSIDGKKQEEA